MKAQWLLAPGLALAAFVAMGAPADAASTTCNKVGHTVVCHSSPSLDDGPKATVQSVPVDWKSAKPEACTTFQRAALPAAICDAREIAATRAAIGRQIAAGQCDEAQKAALGTGDLAYATEVREFCAVKP